MSKEESRLSALAEQPHRRFNALSGEWVLVSPHRALRPWQGQVETVPPSTRPAYDPTCYLCPGNARAGGVRNPDYRETFVFDNDFAALKPAPAGGLPHVPHDGLLVAEAESGRCRVICFTPRHDLTLADMSAPMVRRVVDTWAEEYLSLGSAADVGHVQIFENKGDMMGNSNPHPHGQIWAQRSVPLHVQREADRQRSHFDANGRTLLADYLAQELAREERVVLANDGFVAVVPFWAVWPFETMVISRRPVASVDQLMDVERDQFADIIRQLAARYDGLFDVSFPYSAGIHQAPTDGLAHPEWHLHMHFYPPLLRSATVRKFLVGYEMLGEPQRDITAETAAERLRTVERLGRTGAPRP